jgi:hypothetical protein
LNPQLSTHLQKPRDWAPQRLPAQLQVLSKLTLVVTPTTIAQPYVPINGVLTQVIGQRTELLNVRSQGLHQCHPRVWHREASLLTG